MRKHYVVLRFLTCEAMIQIAATVKAPVPSATISRISNPLPSAMPRCANSIAIPKQVTSAAVNRHTFQPTLR